ncbi:MAG TPA: ATP-binding protein [Gaiellaceae bacterium]|nr:ATP-binding protein [Gaiellaceae bacterium]
MRELDASRFLVRRALPVAVLIILAIAGVRYIAGDHRLILAALTVILFLSFAFWVARMLGRFARSRGEIERAALYRLVAENSPGGAIYVFDRDLRFQLAGGPSLDKSTFDASALEGKTIWEALDPDTVTKIEPAYRAALAGEKSSFEIEFGVNNYRATVTPLRDQAGAVTGGLVQTQEITEQRNLEHQLRQAQKLDAVGQLAGGIAHDFNNLLTVIGGYTTLALARQQLDEGVRDTFSQIRIATERATSLTRQLLAFSRQQHLVAQRLELGKIVEEILPMLSRLIESRVELRSTFQTDVAAVMFDRSQLEQILVNLVINARDAMPGGGTISIEVSETEIDEAYTAAHPDATVGPHVVLTVSDTGHGMDEATRARIFEPFFTTKAETHGTGLGLAVVYGIVNQSGGNIWVYSEVGRGTTFKIYLPAATAADTATDTVDEPAPVVAEPASPGTTVLVVDDHPAVRSLAVAVLEGAGYNVLEAANTSEAGEVLGDHAVDAIVSDIVLPGGGAAAPTYPADARGRSAGVVYMSGYTADMLRGSVLTAQARFLEKPFSPAALLASTAAVID